MNSIVLFISTGRCGTQAIANAFKKVYSDVAVVEHERLEAQYRPKEFLRAYDRIEEMKNYPLIKDHLEYIRNILKDRMYIEAGWPLYPAIPLFYNIFGKNLKLVHLVRHPVQVAMSLVTHNYYRPELRNDTYVRLAQLEPSDRGIIQKEYKTRWQTMSPYEKCLFWWTEINLYAMELERRFEDIPFIRIRAEDLMRYDRSTIMNLVDFMELPFREDIVCAMKERVDVSSHKTDLDLNWRKIFNHPRTMELAGTLGYDFSNIKDEDLNHRYRKQLFDRIQTKAKIVLKKVGHVA